MKIFITFGAGDNNYYEAVNRLTNQANSLNIFDEIIPYTDEYLKNDKVFWNKHYSFIENNKRGYGYWLWKPYIIKKTMETLNHGDVLMYLDCGCEIDIRRREIIQHFLELVKSEYLIGSSTFCPEKEWNKMDLIEKLGLNDAKYLDSEQNQAGALLFLINDKTIDFINRWYELCCDYHNIDDSPSIIPNLDCFVEHRHDQSIFSLLTKKYNLYSNYSLHDCINYSRNKSGTSKL